MNAAPRPEHATLGSEHRRWSVRLAEAGIDSPALDARLLLADGSGLPPASILTEPERVLTGDEVRRVDALMRRRLAREPVSRILGRRAFWGLDLEISPATLDPRPDTETLVEEALRLVRAGEVPGGEAPRIADLGTGSGAILIALLRELPHATGVATDVDPAALEIAQRNARAAGVDDRFEAIRTNWLDGVAGSFGLIVSNPPYIASQQIERLDLEVRRFDPRAALDGGADGLDAYRALIPQSLVKVALRGHILLEIGVEQPTQVADIALSCGIGPEPHSIRTLVDLSGRPRCVALRARR